jgi:2-iminobutanoate/2-iminopropanoate deaminase
MQSLQAILESAGASLQTVVKTTVFLGDMNDFTAMNAVYAEFFGDHKPARSTIQAARLPRDVKVEIDAIAALPEKTKKNV